MSDSVLLFNPDNDMALASFSPYYKSPAGIMKMASDLELLPFWFANASDWVKVSNVASALAFIKNKENAAFDIGVGITDSFLDKRYLPWGWNPALVLTLRNNAVDSANLPSDDWMEHYRILSGRNHYADLLRRLRQIPNTCGMSQVCDSLFQVVDFIRQHEQVVLKAPWSGSGRGMMKLSGSGLTTSAEGWISRILRTQKCIMAEPLYNKVCDFAMEFKVEDGRVDFAGYSLFETDCRGSYKGNVLLSDAAVEKRLFSFVPSETVFVVRDMLLTYFSAELSGFYSGYLGVDMMICQDDDSEEYRLHPLVEVNLRSNMGVVSRLLYNRFVSPLSSGKFVVEYYGSDGEAFAFHQSMQKAFPLVMSNGKIISGYLSLTPVSTSTRYQAFVHVAGG